MALYVCLVMLPIVLAFLVMRVSFEKLKLLLLASSALLSYIALTLYVSPPDVMFSLHGWVHIFVFLFDVGLILYFLKEGLTNSNSKVWVLASIQLTLFLLAEFSSHGVGSDFVIDELASFMFVVINVVGSLIVVYALWYINQEEMSEDRKRVFLMYLCLFLAIMNMIVASNSLMLFFLLFELTTLASYLLIGFRKDELSQNNALKALWMNQIGGIAILLAVLLGDNAYFDALTPFSAILALVAIAALIKGAQVPFDSWLLGAMVAPTPVSAILHSATMVKIAPFVILKISPALSGTTIGSLLIAFGGIVFVVGALYGLSKDRFKEILGYSTISLLGLMVAMAASIGVSNPDVVYMLIFFHALSKALLFLQAGIIEKKYHIKDVSQMDGLLHFAPLSASVVIFGFATITLPPFGLFLAKLFSIEMVASNLDKGFAHLVLLICLALGSALLTLLYFKVASSIFSKSIESQEYKKEKVFDFAYFSVYMYTLILLISALFIFENALNVYMYISLICILLAPLWILISHFKGVDRVREYHCGEQSHFSVIPWNFELSNLVKISITSFGILVFTIMFLGGVL